MWAPGAVVHKVQMNLKVFTYNLQHQLLGMWDSDLPSRNSHSLSPTVEVHGCVNLRR